MREIMADDLGLWAIKMSYDSTITYGIKLKPSGYEAGRSEFDKITIEPLLMMLATRALTGNEARDSVVSVMNSLNERGQTLLYKIISRDWKMGVGSTVIQKIAPNIVPSFKVMRAGAYEARLVKGFPVLGEYKLDGQRNSFVAKSGVGNFFTRSGKVVESLSFAARPFIEAARFAADYDPEIRDTLVDENGELSFMLDGEALMGLFADTGALRRKGHQAKDAEFHLYDIMSYEAFQNPEAHGLPQAKRRNQLMRFVAIARWWLKDTEFCNLVQIVDQEVLNSTEEIESFFLRAREKTLASYLARGDRAKESSLLGTTVDQATGKPKTLEGAMIKDPLALYQRKKSNSWLKMKAEETEDLPVVGAYPGDPGTKYENCLGGLITLRGDVEVRVGGGYSDVEREDLWKKWRAIEEFYQLKKARRGSGCVVDQDLPSEPTNLFGRLVEVKFHEVTPDGSLRHPNFVRFRDDKQGDQ